MKKRIPLFIAPAIIMILVSCSQNAGSGPFIAENTETPHPFSAALTAFFNEVPEDIWGGMSGNDFWDENAEISNTAAFLIDLDGNGTLGVAAYKGIGEMDFFRIFYMLNGELHTKDFEKLWFYPFEISGYPIATLGGGEGAGTVYTFYSLASNGIAAESDVWASVHGEFYYRETDSDGTFFGLGKQILEDKFLEILDYYNINENRWLPFILKPQEHRDGFRASFKPDDTAAIIAMTLPSK